MEDQKDALLKKFAPMARRIAGGFRLRVPVNVEFGDLTAAAMSGLWDAVRSHPEGGPGFGHYAAMRIRGAIVDELRAQDWLPRRHRTNVKEGRSSPMHVVLDPEAGSASVHQGDGPDEALHRSRLSSELLGDLALLKPRERQVVLLHYFADRKLREIGAEMGVSEPRVSQIHSDALRKLRAILSPGWRP